MKGNNHIVLAYKKIPLCILAFLLVQPQMGYALDMLSAGIIENVDYPLLSKPHPKSLRMLALAPEQQGWALVPAVVDLSTGFSSDAKSAAYFFRGEPLKEGPIPDGVMVPVDDHRPYCSLSQRPESRIIYQGSHFNLKCNSDNKRYIVELIEGSRRTRVNESQPGADQNDSFTLEWVGDMDHDGHPDFIYNLSNSHCGSWSLLLSSRKIRASTGFSACD